MKLQTWESFCALRRHEDSSERDCCCNSFSSHTLALLKFESFADTRTLLCRKHHFFERKFEVLTRYNQEHNKQDLYIQEDN